MCTSLMLAAKAASTEAASLKTKYATAGARSPSTCHVHSYMCVCVRACEVLKHCVM